MTLKQRRVIAFYPYTLSTLNNLIIKVTMPFSIFMKKTI